MRNLLAFLAKFNHWFVFIILEVVSLALLFRYNSYQGSVWFSTANYVAGNIHELNAGVEAYFHLNQLNRQLTQRNLQLEQQVRMLLEKRADSIAANDTSATRRAGYEMLKGLELISAKVVDNSVNRSDNLITINKGEADGVKKDMGVACGTGVVGIVYFTSKHFSIVIPLLNIKSNVSCSIKGRGYFGYLHWKNPPADIAYLDDVPRHARFKRGDEIVTSGYSSVFPPGIRVGKIINAFNSPDGLSYRLQIRLSTDFAKLRDVCVINDNSIIERLELLRAAQDSIKPQGESTKR